MSMRLFTEGLTLTVERGREIQRKQVAHMADRMTEEQRVRFLAGVERLNASRKITSGWDVPRGTELEALAWEVQGKSPEEYRAYLASMD